MIRKMHMMVNGRTSDNAYLAKKAKAYEPAVGFLWDELKKLKVKLKYSSFFRTPSKSF